MFSDFFKTFTTGLGAMGALGAFGWMAQPAFSQDSFTYTGGTCDAATFSQFTKVSMWDLTKDQLADPVRFAIAKDGRIFIAERKGKIKLRKADGAISLAATISVFTEHEMGIQGMVLDPQFVTNNFIYLHYAPSTPSVWKISRFTVTGDIIDLTTEKVLLEVPVQRQACCHTGGGMAFDFNGNLFISMGNNTVNGTDELSYVDESSEFKDDQARAANTNDLRGKILRIKPTVDLVDGKYYTIPAGNLFAPNTEKTRPEIYTMGHRNPYTISLDPYRGWLTWGDVGPDDGWETEEHNLVTKPGFMGWPYFAGAKGNAHYSYRLNKSEAAPTNTSKWNTGLQTLPAAQGALIGYTQSAAITGPFYYYDGALNSAIKFPPHFDKKWFIGDWNYNYIKVVTMSEAGDRVAETKVFKAEAGGKLSRTQIQLDFGPDGALYVLVYGNDFWPTTPQGEFFRYEYRGTCKPATPVPPTSVRSQQGHRMNLVHPGQRGDLVFPAGAKRVDLFDLAGKRVHSQVRQDASAETRVELPHHLRQQTLKAVIVE
jgi:cytochrome c